MHRKEISLPQRPILNSLLIPLVAGLALAGCSRLEGSKTTSNSQAPQPAATPPTQVSVSTSPVSPAGLPPSAGPAIATADGDLPGIRVEVQELKRTSGDVVNLKFAMINDSDKDLGFGYEFVDPDYSIKDHGGIGGVHLIDPVGKKKYFVARDTESTCLCSRGVPKIASRSRMQLWAKFPAPPEDVQKISIVVPHFIPMDDVPISR
ncbi:MAG: hypothetical protein ABR568_18330 [Pyrinomonadaceae bacterium]